MFTPSLHTDVRTCILNEEKKLNYVSYPANCVFSVMNGEPHFYQNKK